MYQLHVLMSIKALNGAEMYCPLFLSIEEVEMDPSFPLTPRFP